MLFTLPTVHVQTRFGDDRLHGHVHFGQSLLHAQNMATAVFDQGVTQARRKVRKTQISSFDRNESFNLTTQKCVTAEAIGSQRHRFCDRASSSHERR